MPALVVASQALDGRREKRSVDLVVDALGRVDDDERRVREVCGGGDLGAEVSWPRRVDQVCMVEDGNLAVVGRLGEVEVARAWLAKDGRGDRGR